MLQRRLRIEIGYRNKQSSFRRQDWGDRESTLTLGIPTAKGQRCAIFINQMRDFDTKFSPWTGSIVQALDTHPISSSLVLNPCSNVAKGMLVDVATKCILFIED